MSKSSFSRNGVGLAGYIATLLGQPFNRTQIPVCILFVLKLKKESDFSVNLVRDSR